MAADSAAVDVRDNQDRSRFEIYADGVRAGFVQYRRTDGGITFVHTVVDAEFEGKGLASQLIKSALDTARQQGLVVTPTCPFVAAYIRRHPEYQDLVTPSS